jgi:hypothetical protein
MNGVGQTMRFNRVTIRDPAFNNMEGATLLLPEGWTLNAGFFWMPNFLIQVNLLYTATDPMTSATAQTLPLQQYVWSQPTSTSMPIGENWLGSIYLPPPQHPAEFVQAQWMPGPLQHLWGARLSRVEDLPQYAAELARTQGAGRTVYATRLRYEYQYGGRMWEEDVYLTLIFNPPSGMLFWYGLGHTLRAPAGMLDGLTPLLSVPIQSLRETLDWSAAREFVRELFRQHRQQEMADQVRLNHLWIQYREQMRQSHQQEFMQRQASQDRQNFAMHEILGGVQTYVNPFDSRPVELPPNYRHFWVSNDGQILATNNELEDPRSDNRREWRHMELYRPW